MTPCALVSLDTPARFDAAIDLAVAEFAHFCADGRAEVLRELCDVEPGLSRGVVVEGRLVGCALMGAANFASLESDRGVALRAMVEWPDRAVRGIEIMALLVIPEHRGEGLGALLRDQPRLMEADFGFGEAAKNLDNKVPWLRSHTLIGETEECWFFMRALAPDIRILAKPDIDDDPSVPVL